jgi:hypothetical protein
MVNPAPAAADYCLLAAQRAALEDGQSGSGGSGFQPIASEHSALLKWNSKGNGYHA